MQNQDVIELIYCLYFWHENANLGVCHKRADEIMQHSTMGNCSGWLSPRRIKLVGFPLTVDSNISKLCFASKWMWLQNWASAKRRTYLQPILPAHSCLRRQWRKSQIWYSIEQDFAFLFNFLYVVPFLVYPRIQTLLLKDPHALSRWDLIIKFTLSKSCLQYKTTLWKLLTWAKQIYTNYLLLVLPRMS